MIAQVKADGGWTWCLGLHQAMEYLGQLAALRGSACAGVVGSLLRGLPFGDPEAATCPSEGVPKLIGSYLRNTGISQRTSDFQSRSNPQTRGSCCEEVRSKAGRLTYVGQPSRLAPGGVIWGRSCHLGTGHISSYQARQRKIYALDIGPVPKSTGEAAAKN
jgi:hypothetical protein